MFKSILQNEEKKEIVEAIRDEEATVMLGAPTFIRPMLKKAQPIELRSLDLVVTGAEKLPDDLYKAFLETFHIEILQGYGLTETSPAANINQPNPPIVTSTGEPQQGKRFGAVGRIGCFKFISTALIHAVPMPEF